MCMLRIENGNDEGGEKLKGKLCIKNAVKKRMFFRPKLNEKVAKNSQQVRNDFL